MFLAIKTISFIILQFSHKNLMFYGEKKKICNFKWNTKLCRCWITLWVIYASGMPVLQLLAYDSSLSLLLASTSPGPAGNTQPWVWNVFTFWVCYKLSATTNFAWLGRSLHLVQMLFGSNVFQGFALPIWLSLSDRGSPSQMWTQAKGKPCTLSQSVRAYMSVPARTCVDV